MRATIPFIQKTFDKFNTLCFGGKLPPIPIELSRAKTMLGLCLYKKRRKFLGRTECYNFRLRVSTYYDLPENEVEDIIIHEMIHYYIALNNLRDTSPHGTVFKRMMASINANHGRHITISRRIKTEEHQQQDLVRVRYHVIAVVTFTDGRTGFKVLPRIQQRILNYYNKVGTVKEVKSIGLYMSNAPFFERYPNSGTLAVHYIDRPILMEHLRDADVIRCDGTTLAV